MTTSELPKPFEPNPALRVLYDWFFDAIQVDEHWVREVREVAQRGPLVYVLRNLSPVDFLALDHLTKRYDLPRVRFVNDLRLGVFRPLPGSFLESLKARRQKSPAQALRSALTAGGSAALFLKRPPSVLDVAAGASGGRGLIEGDELLRTLIELQRGSDRPIQLVPQVFLWTNRPDTHGARLLDAFFGPREWPSTARTIGQFLYNYKHVRLRTGEPLDLRAHLLESDGVSDESHVRRIVWLMLRRLERERRAVTGPAVAVPDRQRHQVLRSPKLQKVITHLAGEKSEDRYAVTRKTLRILREMQSQPDGATIKALEMLLDRVFHRVYAGIDVDRAGIEEIREKSKESTIVLLPSHKSHVDYLVLSYVFNYENLSLPMIAAGDNLAFFPLGVVLRRAGAFFIRRQFGGDRLYSATVEAYIRRLMRDGHTIEVFLEGGRSRTGKLLRPKLGLLSMLVDAALAIPNREIVFVPLSIGYERIVETSSYGRELTGGEKQKEDAAGLLKTTEVLRHKYGRINVQFGQHLTLAAICRDLGWEVAELGSPPKRRAAVTRLGNRAMDEINRVSAVTPGSLCALALLSDERRSLAHEDLLLRCRQLLRVLIEEDARVTPRTARDGELNEDSICEALQLFAEGDLLETHRPGDAPREGERRHGGAGSGSLYRVPEQKRVELDMSKNIVIHFFVERGLVATALLMPPSRGGALESTVRERVQKLSELFKYEFRFRADAGFDTIFDETLRAMAAAGELLRDGGRVEPGPGRQQWDGIVWLRTYASILRNFLEGYRIAARGLLALLRGPLSDKDLQKRALATGHRMFLEGEVQRHEAVSKPLFDNAFQAFRDQGYLEQNDGKYALTESFASADAVRAIEGRISGYLELGAV